MAELVRRTRGAQVVIDDHFAMWTDYDLEVRGDVTVDYDLRLSVRFDLSENRTTLDQLDVVRRKRGPDVRGTGLRTLRLQDYLRVTEVQVSHLEANGALTDRDLEQLIARDRRDPATWRELRLRWVYRVYRTAQLGLLDPAAEVQRLLELPASTATRWIRESRDAGIFADAENPKFVTGADGQPRDVLGVPTVLRVADEVIHGDG